MSQFMYIMCCGCVLYDDYEMKTYTNNVLGCDIFVKSSCGGLFCRYYYYY